MRNYIALIFLTLLFSSGCNEILDDPDKVREGLSIEKEQVVEATWKVNYFSGNNAGGEEKFEGVFVEFNQDNTLNLIDNDQKVYTGAWALSNTKDLLVIRSDGKIPAPFNEIENEWVVREVDDQLLRIVERDPDGSEEIDFRAATTDEIPRVCADLGALLTGKEWHIDHLVAANENLTSSFADYVFVFEEEGEINVWKDESAVNGIWNAGIRCDKFQFKFDHDDFEKISSLWYLTYFSEDVIKLSYSRGPYLWELKLSTGEGEGNEFCEEAALLIPATEWQIHLFKSGNEVFINPSDSFKATFNDDGKFIVNNDNSEFIGSWSLSDNCEFLPIQLDGNDIMAAMSGEWHLIVLSDKWLKVVAEDGNQLKEIEFKRESAPVGDDCDSFKRLLEKEHLWKVSYYEKNEDNLSNEFDHVALQFQSEHRLKLHADGEVIEGNWNLKEDCEVLEIISGADHDLKGYFIGEWTIASYTTEKIILVLEENEIRKELHLNL